MRIAYGYNRAEKEFAQGDADDVLLDFKHTERAERGELFSVVLREGDTLLLIDRADLGRGGEVAMLEAKLSELNVSIEIIQHTPAPPRKRGPQSNFQPTPEQEKSLRKLWHDVVYTGPYVQKRVCKLAGWTENKDDLSRARNWLNNRFGPRVKKKK